MLLSSPRYQIRSANDRSEYTSTQHAMLNFSAAGPHASNMPAAAWSAALQLLTASHRPTLQPVEPAVFNRQIEIMLTAAEMRKEREQERFATLPLLMSRCAELLTLNEGMTQTNSPCGHRVLMRATFSLIAAVMA